MRDRFPRTLSLLAVAWLAAALPSRGGEADWPQFRGPDRHGVTAAGGLLRAWGEGQPRELWRRPIGAGFSGVSVVDGRAYTVAVEGGDEVLLALAAEDGSTLWRHPIGPTGEAFPEGGPRSTPTVVDGVAYVASSQGRLVAVRVADGTQVWARDLAETGPAPRFGYSVSPLVDGDLVLVEGGQPGAEPGVLALDLATGETAWGALEGPAGYSSPIVATIDGVRQYVFFRRAGGEVVSLATDGGVLWRHRAEGALAIIVSPVFLPPDRLFVATSDDTFGGLMLRVVRGEDGAFRAEEAWSERLMRNHFNTAVRVGGYLYGFDNATLRCLDAETGERLWARRGLGKGSLVAAGGLLVILGDDGTLVLAEASPEGYRELGRARASEGRAWTPPTLAAGRLYVRDGDEIASFELAGDGVAAAPRAAGGAPAPATDPAGAGAGSSSRGPGHEAGAAAEGERALERLVACHLEARGGAARWREVEALELIGTYAAFSEVSPMRLVRARGDRYKLEFEMLGGAAIRARDAVGPWGRHPLLKPETGRIDEGPYKAQQERESLFEPPLLDAAEKGIEVELRGDGEIDGVATVDLALTFPGDAREVWHLDPESCLEVAVDSTVMDFTQLPEPMRQRAFYRDFREVGGLVLPFAVDLEFGARLEEMRVERVVVDPELAEGELAPPPAPPGGAQGAGAEAAGGAEGGAAEDGAGEASGDEAGGEG